MLIGHLRIFSLYRLLRLQVFLAYFDQQCFFFFHFTLSFLKSLIILPQYVFFKQQFQNLNAFVGVIVFFVSIDLKAF